MKMRVAYDISAGLAQGGGIGRYARELAVALKNHAAHGELDLFLYSSRHALQRLPAQLEELPLAVSRLGEKPWRAWHLAGLPMRGIPGPCDVVHGTDVVVPQSRAPAVITIHDLTPLRFPHVHTRLNRAYLRLALPVMAARVAAIITVSESTRRDVIDYLHQAPEKVTTIYHGVDHTRFYARPAAESAARLAAIGVRPPYILSLGTVEPRKNQARLLEAYARLGPDAPPLVLTGAQGWGNTALARRAGALGIEGRVRFTGYVADELLPDLYAAAELFVYPSLFEGFGLPVAEAMACGAPVVTADNSSLPEVAGDAALLVDATQEEAIADALRRALASPELRRHMRERGYIQAARFSWEAAAQATIAVYGQCQVTRP